MRYEVPQFIEVESKIIGPFTWRQFVYLSGGAGAVIITFLYLPFILFAITGVPFAILAAFLAFHKINNRSFATFLESAFNFMIRKKMYLWRLDAGDTYTVGDSPDSNVQQSQIPETRSRIPQGSLASLSQKMIDENHSLQPRSGQAKVMIKDESKVQYK